MQQCLKFKYFFKGLIYEYINAVCDSQYGKVTVISNSLVDLFQLCHQYGVKLMGNVASWK